MDDLLRALGFLPMTILGRMELQLPNGQWLVVENNRLGIAKESHSSSVQWVRVAVEAAEGGE